MAIAGHVVAILSLAISTYLLIVTYFSSPLDAKQALFVWGGVSALAVVVMIVITMKGRWRGFWKWLGFSKSGIKAGLNLFQFVVTLSLPFAVVGMGAYFTTSQAQNILWVRVRLDSLRYQPS